MQGRDYEFQKIPLEKNNSNPIKFVALNPGGKFGIVALETDLRLFNSQTGQLLGEPLYPQYYDTSGLPLPLQSIAISANGEFFASGILGVNATLLWDAISKQVLGELPTGDVGNGFSEAIAFSPASRALASASRDTGLLWWDLDTRNWGKLATRMADTGQ